MKNLSNILLEKLYLNKDIEVKSKELSLSDWSKYIETLGGNIYSGNNVFYKISLKKYKRDTSPELEIYVSKQHKNYWHACYPYEIRSYYSKDIEIISQKDGNDERYIIKKDDLDSCENGWTFTQHNAEVIVNTLKEIDNE